LQRACGLGGLGGVATEAQSALSQLPCLLWHIYILGYVVLPTPQEGHLLGVEEDLGPRGLGQTVGAAGVVEVVVGQDDVPET
jgi:hypothetical protein